ncbi:MAG: alanine racemase [Candidatus Omnitrophica bacterium]|nr:alanine racemase [Candidatus Omnitrophota bacterium]
MPPLLETSQKKAQQPVWIEIQLNHLLHNLQEVKRLAGPDTAIMSVIKANAYGHGLAQIAKSLEGRVNYFGVSSVAEALALKELDLSTSIFLFGRYFPQELPLILMDGITLTVSSFDEAQEISAASSSLNRITKVHIKVDTGMGRMGIPFRDTMKQIEKISGLPHLELEGIYTHFPTAEAEDDFALRQLADFSLLIEALQKKGITFRYRHAANSSGILRFKETSMNLVRPGLMLYGISSSPLSREFANLKPVLSLKSRINFMKTIRTGESVGYGRTFTADKTTRIAILPIGYSHGYPWNASGKSSCLFHGKNFRIAGHVSMDYLAVDLGDEPANPGEEIILLGSNGDVQIRAEDLAAWASTIPYEIMTGLASHLPRFYL